MTINPIRQPGKAYVFVDANGVARTAEQIGTAFAACRALELAYAKASEDNGGDSRVRWEDVDLARELANEALTHEEYLSTVDDAERFNGVVYEFKKAADTEGGSCD